MVDVGYEVVVRETSDGTEHVLATDSVADGEEDVYEVSVKNPKLEASSSKLSGA